MKHGHRRESDTRLRPHRNRSAQAGQFRADVVSATAIAATIAARGRESLRRIEAISANFVLPGHGEPVARGVEEARPMDPRRRVLVKIGRPAAWLAR